ncbi:MAG: protein kinase [Pseudomonadota bacterium]
MSPDKLGRYDLIRVLGKGAMGLVYEGRDPNLDRRVAIKTIKVENLSEEAAAEYEKRFRTEARSAARLQHPNIVSVYDSGRDLDVAFLVMEFVQGDDLKAHFDSGKSFTLEQTLGLMSDLLSALDYAHRRNIIHRDIKPANLLIEANGRVKLTDFGVARIQDSGDATRTRGTMVGTLKYMSPEQVKGMPVDSRSDLFAAGIVLHQLLTGKRPFDGESDFAIIRQIVGNNPAAPSYFNPKLPAALVAVVAKALAKSRDDRFATAGEFATALEAACREAADPTVTPTLGRSSHGDWSDTVQADGESMAQTYPGLRAGTSPGGSSASNSGSNSAVTQELELVFWKDVKDSQDAEDIELFLVKFPAGVYADLARRRLKKLVGLITDGSDIGLKTSPLAASAASGSMTKPEAGPADTRFLRKTDPTVPLGLSAAAAVARPAADLTRVAVAAKPARENLANRAAAITDQKAKDFGKNTRAKKTPAAASSPAKKPGSKNLVVLFAGGFLLLAVLLVIKLLPDSAPPASSAALTISPDLAASAAVVNVPVAAIPAPPARPAIEQPAAITPALPAASAVATGTATLPLPVLAASAAARLAALAAARKAALEKEKLAKQAQDKPAAPASSPDPAPVAAARTPPVPPAEKPGPTPPANPRQLCEDRVLLGFQICMAEQCAKPAFTNHAICVQRRAMDQQRRENEQLRR